MEQENVIQFGTIDNLTSITIYIYTWGGKEVQKKI